MASTAVKTPDQRRNLGHTPVAELPVQPIRKIFAWFQADGRYSSKNNFPAFTGELPNGDQFYGFPAEDNELKIGKHNGGQLISTPEERKPFGAVATDGAESFSFLRNILPGIGGCLHGASCTYDNTADEDFIIDTLPGQPDTLLITGLSGHGFKFAPVLGELATRFALDEPFGFDLSAFSRRGLRNNRPPYDQTTTLKKRPHLRP